ncbi:MAG: hypothetical protein KY442_05875 [Proteobacteria bacterium]|nr:hypothetical protein [Pseudomonadota bacterium]
MRRLVPAALAVSLLIPGAGAAASPTAGSAAAGVPTRGDVTVLVTLDDRVPDVAAAARAALASRLAASGIRHVEYVLDEALDAPLRRLFATGPGRA